MIGTTNGGDVPKDGAKYMKHKSAGKIVININGK